MLLLLLLLHTAAQCNLQCNAACEAPALQCMLVAVQSGAHPGGWLSLIHSDTSGWVAAAACLTAKLKVSMNTLVTCRYIDGMYV